MSSSHTAKNHGAIAKKIAPSPTAVTPSTQLTAEAKQDAKILAFMRLNSKRLVTACAQAASHAGEVHNWPEMQEYLSLGNSVSEYFDVGNLGQIAEQPRVMSAAAGR